jgi:hypothetical protein
VQQSYRILMQDKELMLLPVLSGATIVLVVGGLAFGFGISLDGIGRHGSRLMYVPMFLLYVLAYAIGIFFQAALIASATERMRGGNPTVGSALAAAGRRAGAILLWAFVAGTVGMVLRAVQERVGFIGKLVVAVVGAGWSLATFFVVPVLILEDRSIPDSLNRSVSVFKKTWERPSSAERVWAPRPRAHGSRSSQSWACWRTSSGLRPSSCSLPARSSS